jgi:hypothetical protein
MKARLLLAFLILGVCRLAHAQYFGISGNCELPGQAVVVSGLAQAGTQPLSGTPFTTGSGVMASYPQCVATVYPAGSGTPVPTGNVYSSAIGAALGNPFTANTDGSWNFYVAAGCYDVTISSGTPPYSQMPTVKTLVDKCVGGLFSVALHGTANEITVTGSSPCTINPCSWTLSIPSLFILPGTINGLTLTALTQGFSIAGGTTSKTLTVNNTITLAGTDGSTLNIGTGGTLGTGAFVNLSGTAPIVYSAGNFSCPTCLTSSSVTLFYQTVEAAGSAQTQRPALNFLAPLTVADSASPARTNVGVNTTGSEAKVVTAAAAGVLNNCANWDGSGGVGDAGFPCASPIPLYTASGTLITNWHASFANCTTDGGSCTVTFSGGAAFTSISSYQCQVSKQGASSGIPYYTPVSGTSVIFSAGGGQEVTGVCWGN